MSGLLGNEVPVGNFISQKACMQVELVAVEAALAHISISIIVFSVIIMWGRLEMSPELLVIVRWHV
ncbi:MAG TPA: hypothetical protein DCM29_10980 [Bacteroides sp.]|nr:hypothetical protein [Bacteroides sp.]